MVRIYEVISNIFKYHQSIFSDVDFLRVKSISIWGNGVVVGGVGLKQIVSGRGVYKSSRNRKATGRLGTPSIVRLKYFTVSFLPINVSAIVK